MRSSKGYGCHFDFGRDPKQRGALKDIFVGDDPNGNNNNNGATSIPMEPRIHVNNIISAHAPAYTESKMAPPDYSDADSDSEPRQGGISMTRLGGGGGGGGGGGNGGGGGYNDYNDTTDNNEDEGPIGEYP